MKRHIIAILIISGMTIFSQDSVNLTILFTNDTNGHPISFNYFDKENVAGIAARATLIKKIKAEKKDNEFLILDSGGIIRGMMNSNIFNGEPDIAGMNSCGYFASGVGTTELYNSIEFFKNLNKKAKFYFLCANIENKNSPKEQICDKFIIKKIGGAKGVTVGIFAVITSETFDEVSDKAKEEIIFNDPIETAKKIVEELRSEKNKVDIVIALTYMGYYPNDERIGSRTLAASVDGIDIIIDGRTGFKLDDMVTVNQTKIVQASKWGFYLGEISLVISEKKIKEYNYKLHPVNLDRTDQSLVLEEDKATLNAIKSKMSKFDVILKKSITKIEGGEFTSDQVNSKETPLGNLICDAMIEYTKADVAFQNAGGIGDVIIKNEFTLNDINNILKYDNELITLNLTGEELIAILEHSMQRMGYGSFLQVGGINFVYSSSTKTIKSATVNGVEVKPYTFYKVAIPSWLAFGGDGYDEFKKIPYKTNYKVVHKEALYQYLLTQKSITPYTGNRIVIEK